jgi:ABC-type polysaccharide/polyol phosphate export permease
MVAYCQGIWRYRYFWLSLVKMDLRSRYRGSVLGMGWSLLQPVVMATIFTAAFSGLFHESPASYFLYVLSGLACWNFVTNSTSSGCSCYFQADSYIRQQPVPLAVYPLRIALGTMTHFLIVAGFCLLMAMCVLGRLNPIALLSIPTSLLLLLMLGWALATLGGLATVHFRDTRHLIEVSFQVLFYITPVFYPADKLPRGLLSQLLHFNPVLPFLDLFRLPLEGHLPSVQLYAKAYSIVMVAVVAASYALSKLEKRLIFHL